MIPPLPRSLLLSALKDVVFVLIAISVPEEKVRRMRVALMEVRGAGKSNVGIAAVQ